MGRPLVFGRPYRRLLAKRRPPVLGALDFTMTQVGMNFGVTVADEFSAFQIASAPFNGDPCAAGLLIRLTATTCDVHPSPAGRELLAATVVLATD